MSGLNNEMFIKLPQDIKTAPYLSTHTSTPLYPSDPELLADLGLGIRTIMP